MKISVIIPTCEASGCIPALLENLKAQTIRPDEIIVVDSGSEDGTSELAQKQGVRVIDIDRSTFDHGGTRDMALRASTGDVVLFLTQDAMPVDDQYIEHLVAPFEDERVAASSGRQIARPEARAFEKEIRRYRYPDEACTWDASSIDQLGIQAFRISDVCSAYRRSAYEAVGGFEHPLLTNEDMLIAADLLAQGFHLAYCPEAVVWHSHNYTLKQEYRRNRLIGRFLERYSHRLLGIGETGEGLRLVVTVLRHLLKNGQLPECLHFCLNCAARLAGNRAGRREERKSMANAKG